MYIIKKNTETPAIANKEIGLQVNAENTKYMVMSRDQNVVKCHYIMRANKFFEMVKQFKYLGTTKQIKIPFVKKLKADLTRRMLAVIQYRIFCLPFCYQKYQD